VAKPGMEGRGAGDPSSSLLLPFINGLQNFRRGCGGLHGVLGSRGAGAPSAPP